MSGESYTELTKKRHKSRLLSSLGQTHNKYIVRSLEVRQQLVPTQDLRQKANAHLARLNNKCCILCVIRSILNKSPTYHRWYRVYPAYGVPNTWRYVVSPPRSVGRECSFLNNPIKMSSYQSHLSLQNIRLLDF